MADLKDYKVEFYQDPLFRTWGYRITKPSGEILAPVFGGLMSNKTAEERALRDIEIHQSRYAITGDELKTKVQE